MDIHTISIDNIQYIHPVLLNAVKLFVNEIMRK